MRVPDGRIENVAERSGKIGDRELPTIAHVYLHGEFLEATNSFVAVRVPVERDTNDKDGPISALLFDIARTIKQTVIDTSKAAVATIPGFAGINRFKPVQEWTYAGTAEKYLAGERPYKVLIDPRLLAKVGEAFGVTGALTLEFTGDPHDAVRVTPGPKPVTSLVAVHEGMEAILMPMLQRPAEAPAEEEE